MGKKNRIGWKFYRGCEHMPYKLNIRIVVANCLIIFLWGSAFTGIRVGLQSYTPEHLALFRMLVGSILLIGIAIILKMKLPEFKDIPLIFLFGFLGFTVYHLALNIGEKTVSSGIASLLVSTTPIICAFLAGWFLQEKFGISKWIGSIISFFGVALISLGTWGFGTGSGILFILIASISESFYFVFQTHYIKKYGFFAFTVYTIIAGTICMLFLLPGLVGEITNSSLASTLSVIYLGIFPTIIPYIILAYLTLRVGSSVATSSLYLTPALSFVIGWFWLGEKPTQVSLLGGLLILAGVSFIHLNLEKLQIRFNLRRRGFQK